MQKNGGKLCSDAINFHHHFSTMLPQQGTEFNVKGSTGWKWPVEKQQAELMSAVATNVQ